MLTLLISAAVAFSFDRITKRVVSTRLPSFDAGLVCIRQVLHRERAYCRRGFRLAMVTTWCVAAIAMAWLHTSGAYLQSSLSLTGAGCALGGAAGNLLDILRRRHVVDFIDLGWWPAFNLADVAIVAGLLLASPGMVPHP